LDPPATLVSSARSGGSASGPHVSIPINRMSVGELRLAERLVLHLSGPLSRWPLPSRETDSGKEAQPQLPWSLSGWDLRLAEAGGPTAVEDFSYVVEAIPYDLPLSLETTERLSNQVFLLLSLIAGQEIGVAPVVGLDAAGRVVWADWGAPRFRPEQSAWRWCPRHLTNHTLPALAIGLTSLANDPALQQVVDRAGRHLLAANGPEVLDVRIPVACTGLELLAWAVLQRHQRLTRTGLDSLPAKGRVRLLLQWAGIPAELPSQFGRWRHAEVVSVRRMQLVLNSSSMCATAWFIRPSGSRSRSGLIAMSFSKPGSSPPGIWNSRSFGCLAIGASTCPDFGWKVGP
jgi:hypothetical protein